MTDESFIEIIHRIIRKKQLVTHKYSIFQLHIIEDVFNITSMGVIYINIRITKMDYESFEQKKKIQLLIKLSKFN